MSTNSPPADNPLQSGQLPSQTKQSHQTLSILKNVSNTSLTSEETTSSIAAEPLPSSQAQAQSLQASSQLNSSGENSSISTPTAKLGTSLRPDVISKFENSSNAPSISQPGDFVAANQPVNQPLSNYVASTQQRHSTSSIKSLLHSNESRQQLPHGQMHNASSAVTSAPLPSINLPPPGSSQHQTSGVGSMPTGGGHSEASFAGQQPANRIPYHPLQMSSGPQPVYPANRKPAQPLQGPPPSSSSSSISASSLQESSIKSRLFMALAKEELADSPRVWDEFLVTMRLFKSNKLGMNEVIARITRLFKKRRKLLEEFNSFLPENCKLDIDAVIQQYENEDKQRQVPEEALVPSSSGSRQQPISSAGDLPPIIHPSAGWNLPMAGPPSAFPSISSMGMSIGSQQQHSYHPSQMSYSSQTPSMQKPIPSQAHAQIQQGPAQHFSHAPSALGNRPAPQVSAPSSASSSIGSTLPPLVSHSIQAQPPQQQPHQPQPLSSSSIINEQLLHQLQNEDVKPAILFIQKIRHRFLREPDVFKAFLNIVDEFQHEQRTLNELYLRINTLFVKHPDIIEDFKTFLPEEFGSIDTQNLQPSILFDPSFQKFSHFQLQADKQQAASMGKFTQNGQPLSTFPASQFSRGPAHPAYSSQLNDSHPSKKQKQMPPIDYYQQSAEELDLFEGIKTFLNSNQLYAEFTRCLNLFNNDLIGIKDLVQIAGNYLNRSPDLFSRFKQFVNVDDDSEILSNAQLNSKKQTQIQSHIPNIDISTCKKYGSYRILPKMYRGILCSGRTELAKEVLNDVLVGCPQFASEEGSFIASKKNQFEEAMFKCEDDRFEIDMLIDANQATIHVLESLDRKIQSMSLQERSTFRLGPNLGVGTSCVIYKKAIAKIYGDRINEIMEGLYSNPVAAIPVILNRLLAKHEEWSKIQRESQKIWRDIHIKNCYKALDHQSISFKSIDKKTINAKSLLNEIEMIARESRNQRFHHQILSISDLLVMKDLIKIISFHIKRGVSLQSHEKSRLISFFESFFPTLFGFSLIPTMTTTDSTTNHRSHISITASEWNDSDFETEISDAIVSQSANSQTVDSNFPSIFYSNNLIYVLIRIFEIGFNRLASFKETKEASQPANYPKLHVKNELESSPDDNAMKIDADKNHAMPSLPFVQNTVALSLDLQKPILTFDETGNNLYGTLLKMLCKFVSGNLDGNYFEEKCRFLFGSNAFHLFTFDKLVSSIVRQAQVILSDNTCDNLLRLFDTIKTKPKKSFTEYSIKLATESLINQENEPIFRIELIKQGSLGIKMLDSRFSQQEYFNLHPGGLESIEEQWSKYIDRFVSEDNYALIKNCRPSMLLSRILKRLKIDPFNKTSEEPWPYVIIRYDLECKICVNTYRMYFVEDSEDFVLNTKNWPRSFNIKQKRLQRKISLDKNKM